MLPILKKSAVLFSVLFLLILNGNLFAQKKAVKNVPPVSKDLSVAVKESKNDNCYNQPQKGLSKKTALVIGNKDYENQPLRNPINDARLIADALTKSGFKVILKENLTYPQMFEAVDEFTAQIEENGMALFYYAGHGVQFYDHNYLVPVDFEGLDEISGETIDKSLFNLSYLLEKVNRKNALNIIILDACRNAPKDLQLPSGTKAGFSELTNSSTAGSFISFATSPGDVADDGFGYSNGPYAYWFAKSLELSPSRIEDVFMRTRIQVERFTEGEQIPWDHSSLKGYHFFKENKSVSGKSKPINPVLFPPLKTKSFTYWILNNNGSIYEKKIGNSAFFTESLKNLNPENKPLEMVKVKENKFLMGANATTALIGFNELKNKNNDDNLDLIINEMPQHCVDISAFFISRYEITQSQWLAVMGSLPDIPREFLGEDKPIINVSWEEAIIFCQKLSKITGRNYRLPTEAEWEFAAKGDSEGVFSNGNTLIPAISNYFWLESFGLGPKSENTLEKTWNVGESDISNSLGLYDMQGNVNEWCQDTYFSDYNNAPSDGSAQTAYNQVENARVIRGGSWEDLPVNCRITSRWNAAPDRKAETIGFRIVAD